MHLCFAATAELTSTSPPPWKQNYGSLPGILRAYKLYTASGARAFSSPHTGLEILLQDGAPLVCRVDDCDIGTLEAVLIRDEVGVCACVVDVMS
jgi:hypothetical protein